MSGLIKTIGIFTAVCLLLASAVLADSSQSVWKPFGEGTGDRRLEVVAPYEGSLVVAGWPSGSETPYLGVIQRWDGSAWQPMGDSLGHVIQDLVVYHDQLIAVVEPCIYQETDRDTLTTAVAWNGTDWIDIGFGPDGDFKTALVWNDMLVVGGQFDSAAGVSAHGVAAWDGTSWSAMGEGLNGQVWSLLEFEGDLIAGGMFQQIGDGTPARRVARFDGVSWQPMGDGLPDCVSDLALYDGHLVASCQALGGVPLDSVVPVSIWDGSSWSPLAGGTDFVEAYSLTEFQGLLFAAGRRYNDPVGYPIARFDGTEWLDDITPNGAVQDMLVDGGDLIIAGNFLELGDYVVKYGIAWRSSLDQDADGVFDSEDNCIWTQNPDQADSDSNGIGDACQSCCMGLTRGDIDQSGEVDITDVQYLIDNQFLTLTPVMCEDQADLDESGELDITDLSLLVDNQFLTLAPLPPCP